MWQTLLFSPGFNRGSENRDYASNLSIQPPAAKKEKNGNPKEKHTAQYYWAWIFVSVGLVRIPSVLEHIFSYCQVTLWTLCTRRWEQLKSRSGKRSTITDAVLVFGRFLEHGKWSLHLMHGVSLRRMSKKYLENSQKPENQDYIIKNFSMKKARE